MLWRCATRSGVERWSTWRVLQLSVGVLCTVRAGMLRVANGRANVDAEIVAAIDDDG
jgi:hypothetical protein